MYKTMKRRAQNLDFYFRDYIQMSIPTNMLKFSLLRIYEMS